MSVPSLAELEQLFRQCDSDGSGHLDRIEVGNLCANLGIGGEEADNLFSDLDHDGDGKIDFNDFKRGFEEFTRQFATSARPAQLASDENENVNLRVKQVVGSESRSPASYRRHTFHPRIPSPLDESTMDRSSHETERMVEELVANMKRMEEENRKLAEIVIKEKREHQQQLSRLEEEIDNQVKEVEVRMRSKAKEEVESERKSMRDMLRQEMTAIESQMAMFDKVENWLKTNSTADRSLEDDERLNEMKRKLQESLEENRQLRMSMLDTQTNVAFIRSELAQLKEHYESRCKDLISEKTRLEQVLNDQEHISRHLHILQNTNRNLQDTNDALKTALHSENATPNISPRHTRKNMKDKRGKLCRMERGSILSDYVGPTESGPDTMAEDVESDDREREDEGTDEEVFKSRDMSVRRRLTTKKRDDEDSGISNDTYSQIHSQAASLNLPHSPILSSLESTAPESIISVGPPERTFKVIFVGDSCVGKSSFILRLTKNVFASRMSSTLGVDFQMFMTAVDNKPVALQLWDTAGQERFRSITKSYFRKADGVVLMYDVTSECTFLNIRQWLGAALDSITPGVPLLLLGNKIDLRASFLAADRKCVNREQGQQMAEQYGIIFGEVSVKDSCNIHSNMSLLTRTMMKNEDGLMQVAGLQLAQEPPKNSYCCSK